MAVHVKKRRSLAKALSFRVLGIISDIIVIYVLTRRVDLTAGLVVATNIPRTIIYFAHERFWNRIGWGRTELKRDTLVNT